MYALGGALDTVLRGSLLIAPPDSVYLVGPDLEIFLIENRYMLVLTPRWGPCPGHA